MAPVGCQQQLAECQPQPSYGTGDPKRLLADSSHAGFEVSHRRAPGSVTPKLMTIRPANVSQSQRFYYATSYMIANRTVEFAICGLCHN